MFRVVETFSGIGAQAKALEKIGINYQIVNTCDWDIRAIIAYCQIHKGKVDMSRYASVSDEEISSFLQSITLSMDGKKPTDEKMLGRISAECKKTIIYCNRENEESCKYYGCAWKGC